MSFNGAEELKALRSEWANVVGWRNDLIHADVSRLVEIGPEPNSKGRPSPTPEALAEKPPSWAVDILTRCLEQLHEQTQTHKPAWLKRPPE
jgi:hypothetical protein